jgi:hypothetical protein
MKTLKAMFSQPGVFNNMSTIFELQPQISFVSARTQHCMPVPHKPQEANKRIIVILICCYFCAILIPIVILTVSIRIGITIRIEITTATRTTIGITITK